MKHWTKYLPSHACATAVDWCLEQPSPETAWQVCERGDWMLWLIGSAVAGAPWSDERKLLVACAVDCSALALPYVSDVGLRACIGDVLGTMRAWSRGEVAREQVVEAWKYSYTGHAAPNASDAAVGAAHAAFCTAANTTAANTTASYTASSAAHAAALYTAHTALHAVAHTAAFAAWARVIHECADVVRRHFPVPPALIGRNEETGGD